MTSWLRSQLKADVQSLADEAGMSYPEGARKDDIVDQLDVHLRANASSLAANPTFAEFYSRTKGSPVKRDTRGSVAPMGSDSEPKTTRSRRRTIAPKVKEEPESMDDYTPTTAVVKTPGRAIQRRAARIPLPASPALVTDIIERKTKAARRRVSGLWEQSGITQATEDTRERISSVIGINVFLTVLEAVALQRQTIPWKYAFSTPAIPAAGIRSHGAKMPDLFVLLTSAFWNPTLLWAFMSIALPLTAAYFFNVTLQSRRDVTKYTVDPLTFNVAKAVLAWLVYGCGVRFFGLIGDETVSVVDSSLPYPAPVVGAGAGILFSLYEAILRK